MTTLKFVAGTIEVRGLDDETVQGLPGQGPLLLTFDRRARCYRAPARHYAELVLALRAADVEYEDLARNYSPLPLQLQNRPSPRPYQVEALRAWLARGARGVVVLPTGAGKSHLAVMAIERQRRPALVVVPTLDLVRQWYDLLGAAFAQEIGVIGGGDYRICPLTVTTYDSSYLHMEHIGNRFGLLIFDECHHLPSESYALGAQQCLAPFRLGLSATPERADGRHAELETLIGPIVYHKNIVDLSGEYLSDYAVRTIEVRLTDAEREEYDRERDSYLQFLRANGIRMSSPSGFTQFIMRSAQSREGQRAMQAYRRQRELALAAPAKLEVLERLMQRHAQDRMLVFTQDNRTAYHISREFLVPVITHQTKITERSEILKGLANGTYNAVVTSKVLNEGVDVPEANVAVVISGSGSVREHVQRLGRILRRREGKHALLYEVISARTGEAHTSERRRDHDAYR